MSNQNIRVVQIDEVQAELNVLSTCIEAAVNSTEELTDEMKDGLHFEFKRLEKMVKTLLVEDILEHDLADRIK